MLIKFVCECGRRLQAKDKHVGKQAKCPGCGVIVTIPSNVAPTEAGASLQRGIAGPGDRKSRLEETLRKISGKEDACDMLMWKLANATMDGEPEGAVLDFLEEQILERKVPRDQLLGVLKEAMQELQSSSDYFKPSFTNLARYEKDERQTDNKKDLGHALWGAVLNGNAAEAERLIACGADVQGLLHHAVSIVNIAAVRMLLSHGADPNMKNDKGKTPLALARDPVYDKNDEIRSLLKEHGAHLTSQEAAWELLAASGAHSISHIERALSDGAEVNCRSKHENKTPLDKAAMCGDQEAVAFLVHHGADTRAKDNWGNTPLSHAVNGRAIETVQFLLEHDADVNDRDNKGQTPLDIALKYEKSEGFARDEQRLYSEMAVFLREQGGKTGREVLASQSSTVAEKGSQDKTTITDLLIAQFQFAARQWEEAHEREQCSVSLSSDEFHHVLDSTRPVKERSEKEVNRLIAEAREKGVLDGVLRLLQHKGDKAALFLIDGYL